MAKQEIDFSLDNPENAAVAGEQKAEAPSTEETDELQVDVGPEPDEKPEVVTMTPEEFAALKASSDSAKAVKEGIEGLASRLVAPPAAPAPANAPQQTPEEFFEEHADEMFDPKKGGELLAKHQKMVAEREFAPLLQGMSTKIAGMSKKLLRSEDPHFKKYEAEVDALVAQQPPNVRNQPNIYELAWQQVRQNHQAEIEEETVNERVNKALDEKLRALGLDPTKPIQGQRPPAHVNSASRSTPAVSSAGGSTRRVRLPDEKTLTALKAEAQRKGLDLEDLLKTRGYMPR